MESDQSCFLELENLLNNGAIPSYILQTIAIKGEIGRENQNKFIVNSDDHGKPHIHISINNHQIASYWLETGEPRESNNPRLDKVVKEWLQRANNRADSLKEWERFHGR